MSTANVNDLLKGMSMEELVKLLPANAFEELKTHVVLRESVAPAAAQPPPPLRDGPPSGPKAAPGSRLNEPSKALLEAVHNGDEAKYRHLVQQFPNSDLQQFRDDNNNTLLYEACRQRKYQVPCVAIVTDLHSRGLSATIPSGFMGSTALHGLFQGLRKWYEAGSRTDAEVVEYVKTIRLVKMLLVASNSSLSSMLNFDHLTAEAELEMFLRTVTNATHNKEMGSLK